MEEAVKTERKKVILSGIQPTGVFTLGNYIGAIRNWDKMQDEYNCAYFVADLHSLTVRQDPAALRKQTLDAFAFVEGTSIMLKIQAQKNTQRSETGVLEGHFATLDEALAWLKEEVKI